MVKIKHSNKLKNKHSKKVQLKNKKKSNKFFVLGVVGVSVVLVLSLLAFFLKYNPMEVTGSSIYVKSYGVSGTPLETQFGKYQTYFELWQPTLMNLVYPETRTAVTTEIAEQIDFSQLLTLLYQNNHPSVWRFDALDFVSESAAEAKLNFIADTSCLNNIGANHGRGGYFNVIIVSELSYRTCNNAPRYYSANLKHTFFNEEGNAFVCDQESLPLFLVNIETGEVTSDTTMC